MPTSSPSCRFFSTLSSAIVVGDSRLLADTTSHRTDQIDVLSETGLFNTHYRLDADFVLLVTRDCPALFAALHREGILVPPRCEKAAAKGTPVKWYVAEEDAATRIQDPFHEEEINISVEYKP